VAINLDGTLAQPEGSLPGVATRPARISDPLMILATGLGPTSPPGVTSDDCFDENGFYVPRNTTTVPRVLIGGMEAQVTLSRLSPQFVGVNQVNVTVPDQVEPGGVVFLVIESGGVRSREDVAVAAGV
jgi:uncharacterized protein (TIGR03437 family)